MSVWDSLVGQQPVIDMLSRIAQGDPSQIAQSWLICGPPGSGRSNMARAFAAALESPDHGMSDEPTRVTQQVLAGTHPDVTVLATNKVTIGIDQVREIITTSEQMPATAPWRIIVDRGCGPHAGAHHQRAAEGDWGAGRTLHLAALCAPMRPGRAADHPLAHAHCESRRALRLGSGRIPDCHHGRRAESRPAGGPS